VDLDGFLKRTCITICQQESGRLDEGAGGRAETTDSGCSRKTQDKFVIPSMVSKLLHRCTGAHTRVVEIYIYICVYGDIYACMYMYIHMHMYIYIYPCIYVYVCVCMYINVCVYMYTYIYVHVYMYIYMYIYESICIFAESMHAFTGVVEHHVCAGVYIRQML